jgi:hypothetical protein
MLNYRIAYRLTTDPILISDRFMDVTAPSASEAMAVAADPSRLLLDCWVILPSAD